MKVHGLLIGLLFPILAHSEGNAKFNALRSQAEPLGGLGVFLEKYVGQCGPGGAECQRNAARFRKEANGKKFYTTVTEDSAQVALGEVDGDEVTLLVTPFFGAAGSALTHGAPSRTDKNGNPVLSFIQVKGTLPEGMDEAQLRRLCAIRGIRLAVVFAAQGVWTLPQRGGKKIQGVKGRILGMTVTVGRTGQELGVWTNS